jgi:hypothetical protein
VVSPWRLLRLWLKVLDRRRIATYPPLYCGVLLVAVLADAVGSGGTIGADFGAFDTAGALLRTGRSAQLYDMAAATLYQAQRVPGAEGTVSAWMSPPVLAWAFVPLSRLPFFAAFLTHTAIQLSLAALALVLLTRELPNIRWPRAAWAAALYWPTMQWLAVGQTSGLWLLLYTMVFVFLRRGSELGAGMALGCLALKPQLAFGLFVLLIAARKLRALAAAIATTTLWAAISYASLPGATLDFVRNLPWFSAFLRAPGYHSAGLRGLFQQGPLLLDGFSPTAATCLGVAFSCAAVGTLFCIWSTGESRTGERGWDLRMAASLALCALLSPHLFGYDLVLFVLPFVITWNAYAQGTGGRPLDGGPIFGAAAAVWLLAMPGPVLTEIQQWLSMRFLGRRFAVQLDVVAALWWIASVLAVVRNELPLSLRSPVAVPGASAPVNSTRSDDR